MSRLDHANIIKDTRGILLDIDELKTTQAVGTSQIVAKPYDSGNAYDLQFTLTKPFQSIGSSYQMLRVDVTPINLPDDNILITDIVPDFRRTNGTRFSQWENGTINWDNIIAVIPYSDGPENVNTYLIFIVGPTNLVLRLKSYIMANCDVRVQARLI